MEEQGEFHTVYTMRTPGFSVPDRLTLPATYTALNCHYVTMHNPGQHKNPIL